MLSFFLINLLFKNNLYAFFLKKRALKCMITKAELIEVINYYIISILSHV